MTSITTDFGTSTGKIRNSTPSFAPTSSEWSRKNLNSNYNSLREESTPSERRLFPTLRQSRKSRWTTY